MTIRIFHYLARDGWDLFQDWLDGVRDMRARVAVQRRVDRLKLGNFGNFGDFGNHGFCREGVWELRVGVGAGYRVYYALSGAAVVLPLSGGSKRTQDSDISRAVGCWRDYLRRSK